MVDAKVIKEDVRALNAVLMYVKAGDRNRAVKWVDSMDTLVSDVIPRSIYNWIYKGYSTRPGAKEKMATGEPDLRSFRLPGEMAAVRKKIEEYTKALNNDDRSGKYTNAAARCKAIGAMYGSGGGSLSSLYEEYADALKNRGYARPGEKAKFGLRYVKVLKSKPCLPREARIFQDTEDNSYFVKYFENDNVVKEDEADSLADATDSAQAFIKSGTRPAFSRSGAKAKFGNVDRLESLMAACYRALKNNNKAAAKRLIEDASKEIDSSIPAYIVSEYRDLRRSMHNSRPGVKAKFEYSQSDYMALRRYYQLAMTGNPDVFEDNTAMRLANKAIASPNYRPSSSAAWSHDLAKELIDGFEGM
jgi:hypothetical protein